MINTKFDAAAAEQINSIAASAANNDSARLCLRDARSLYSKGERYDYAAGRALASLKHSVGVFSPQYDQAAVLFENARLAA